MHTRRSATIPSLSLVLPHPPLPRRASSIRSSNDGYTTPRTPRSSCGLSSPSLLKLDMPAPRTSTDSWNSSVADGGEDDMEWEWTAEQEALLGKTLDSLPAHLLTPFNGSAPPGNLLDKVAKRVIHAKNPMEWPHSIRATRAKLHKLARVRAEEANSRGGRNAGEYSHDVLQQTTNVQKKPLYRQSSMDFLRDNTLKDEKSLERLSNRLQSADRIIPDPRSTTPSGSARPFSLGDEPRTPRTPIDSPTHQNIPTIQVAAPAGRAPRLRRSTTTISNLPAIQSGVVSTSAICNVNASLRPQTRSITRIRRSESFSSHGLNGVGHSLKRAPSYGTISSRSCDSSRMSVDEEQKENDPRESVGEIDIYPSSDEEERVRGKKVKKQRTAGSSVKGVTASASNATLTVPKPTSKTSSSAGISSAKKSSAKAATAKPKTRITRSSSMFGAELPHPQQQPMPPAPRPVPVPVPAPSVNDHHRYTHQRHHSLSSPAPMLDMSVSPSPTSPLSPSLSPSPLPHRTLRRIKTTNFPSRRISFGNLVAKCSLGGPATVQEESSGEMAAAMSEENGAAPTGHGLGSAFQMQ